MEEITKNEKAGYIEILNKIEPQAMGMFDNIIKIDPLQIISIFQIKKNKKWSQFRRYIFIWDVEGNKNEIYVYKY